MRTERPFTNRSHRPRRFWSGTAPAQSSQLHNAFQERPVAAFGAARGLLSAALAGAGRHTPQGQAGQDGASDRGLLRAAAAGQLDSFRRFALFPVGSPGPDEGRDGMPTGGGRGIGTLVPVYASSATFSRHGRGLMALPESSDGSRSLATNVPLWTLVALFAVFSMVWMGTIGRLSDSAATPLALTAIGERAAVGAELLRSVAASVPRARTVVLARLRSGPFGGRDDPWWTLVEVDGQSLRTAPDAASVEAALAAAGFHLEPGDRVLVIPNAGAPLNAGARSAISAGGLAVNLSDAAAPLAAPRLEMPAHLPLSAAPGLLGGLPAPGLVSNAGGAGALPRAAATPTPRLVVQRAVPFTVADTGIRSGGRVAADTVGEALRAVGVDVDGADLVTPQVEAPLLPGMKISILRARSVTITGPDLQVAVRSIASTVGELLAERSVQLGPLDRVEPPMEAPLPVEGTVRVVRVRHEERIERQLVPFKTVTRQDAGLSPGRRVQERAGLTGLIERLVNVVFEDGQEARHEVITEQVTRDPIDEVVIAGPPVVTALSFPTIPLGGLLAPPAGVSIRRMVLMESTAYDPGPISTGKRPGDPGYGITASGMRAVFGVVAVDPRVIPMHSRLYIPGYGYAVAADTGGAIKGNRIDLFYPTYGEAIQWGRRTIPVYLLD